mmetsp:Transcript_91290/g.190902  ORF Transcript_91290/g.190902 Transcript_91290/m.190902 type:complete len:108 (-) Transcript_91290:240-563(-)|eukprot:CAMPEP_0206463216 /NCGR_PEP_ID=MMETSP0324_2-20121206/26457_1 /ASSEMBLY_ACC=CAM_ASM_000836 /TAXON_ID=2866 /ORGANISM="Crypthecodinium cohnii, Strain Seligo" /LENGTH=107 /DNA_ID=CAMNT_0053935551 /DNA_START=63 /DNA_END=386 /DNA_ORIENTATION=-
MAEMALAVDQVLEVGALPAKKQQTTPSQEHLQTASCRVSDRQLEKQSLRTLKERIWQGKGNEARQESTELAGRALSEIKPATHANQSGKCLIYNSIACNFQEHQQES